MLELEEVTVLYGDLQVLHGVSLRVQERAAQRAGSLSGGEQQMCFIARA